MAAYECQCQTCAGRFDRRQKMSDPEVEFCPQCGGRQSSSSSHVGKA